jgi:hypothetical protein
VDADDDTKKSGALLFQFYIFDNAKYRFKSKIGIRPAGKEQILFRL